MKIINGKQLKQILDAGRPLVLLEALPEKYYRSGHLPGAVALAPDQVDRQAATLIPDRAAPVVVYCASETCNNSHQAAARLSQLGYQDVTVYPGGKAEWQELGFPLVKPG
jgi:rhodanese-related sulfurtransferase